MGGEVVHGVEAGEIAARRITRDARPTGGGQAGSSLLGATAVVLASADEGRDYLGHFAPFVIDRLKQWPVGHAVEPRELSEALCEGWGFPSVPSAVSRVLLQRAEKEGMVSSVDRRFYPTHEALLGVADLGEKKQELLAGLNALAGAVVRYAAEVHGLTWTEATANAALERLTEDFGAELATARREGGLAAGAQLGEDEALAVVYGFARGAVERDPENFARIVAMVQGTMIANALYFEDIRKLPNRLPELRVYLDTSPLLRALGLASGEVVLAATEMLTLMRSFRIPMFVFSHTVDEMTAILERIADSLKRGRTAPKEQAGLTGRAREAIDAAVQAGMTSGEVQALVANIELRLGELGVRRCETPPHREAGHIDEHKLGEMLSERIEYRSRGPLEKDLDSLAAVDRLRGSHKPRDLAKTRALFVTANGAVAKTSRTFFKDIGRDAPVPHCMTDVALTAQLWVRSSSRKPDLPRRLLIADCYSALGPGPALWERWVSHIVKLRERNELTEEQLQTLIYHQQTKALLYEVVRGRPENVSDEAVAEVLARYEAEVRRPGEDEARAAHAASEREHDELAQKVVELSRWKRNQEAENERARRRQAGRRTAVRRFAGLAAAAVMATAYAVFALSGPIGGKFWWATSTTLLVLCCAASVSLGFRRGWRAPLAVLAAAGALSALWANVFGVAAASREGKPGASSGSASGSATQAPGGRK
jgi:hypothetical protein